MATRRGAYPGTFSPPTVAHVAVAEAARTQCRLDRVDLVVSTVPLGKHDRPDLESVPQRVLALERVAANYEWLTIAVTDLQLLADIAEGYDVLVLGADKWAQLNEPAWYGGADARDAALARLPELALAPRPPHALPDAREGIHILDIDPLHHSVSATAVRNGESRWLAPGAHD